jgi:hypothetical protein
MRIHRTHIKIWLSAQSRSRPRSFHDQNLGKISYKKILILWMKNGIYIGSIEDYLTSMEVRCIWIRIRNTFFRQNRRPFSIRELTNTVGFW